MRVSTATPKTKRKGGHLPRRLDRQRFKPAHRHTRRWRRNGTETHAHRMFNGTPTGQRYNKVAPTFSGLNVVEGKQRSDSETTDLGLQDTWHAVADLWSRLGFLCRTRVARQGDQLEVVFSNVRAGDWDDDSLELIRHVTNIQSYRWRQDGRSGEFVQFIEHQDNELVLMTASLGQMGRWPGGNDVSWQVKCFLLPLIA